jgi:C-terminal processing protease CtpA/Prc
VKTASGEFGYLRIRSFFVSDIKGFIDEVARVLKLLPQTGLIFDVRDNPGGSIPAGEGLLQFFSDNKVIPAPVSFRNTALNRLIIENFPPFESWKKSIELSVETGEAFSQGFPLSPIDEINKIGRVYQGKVVLITSPLSISTVDFLAAGFRDNEIGSILGVDTNMGAGGANVVTHEEIRTWLEKFKESPFKPLPKGVQMRVSIRRSTRIGKEALGLPVEGLGVEPDEIHRITLNDLLNQNVDLIAHAGQLLAKAWDK